MWNEMGPSHSFWGPRSASSGLSLATCGQQCRLLHTRHLFLLVAFLVLSAQLSDMLQLVRRVDIKNEQVRAHDIMVSLVNHLCLLRVRTQGPLWATRAFLKLCVRPGSRRLWFPFWPTVWRCPLWFNALELVCSCVKWNESLTCS